MEYLHGIIRNYDWGSTNALAELTGRPHPTAEPEAEMWFGAHSGSPSELEARPVGEGQPAGTRTTLLEAIEADPQGTLGEGVAERFGRLPFLLKLLAADRALSIQAHPTKQQAEEGFARENAAGVPLDAFHRNYKDDNHKPELLVALTEFRALAGFRPVKRTLELFDALNVAGLMPFADILRQDPSATGVRLVVAGLFDLSAADLTSLLDALLPRVREFAAGEKTHPEWVRQTLRGIAKIAEQYPNDVGILVALLLNHVALEPGQAIYLDAGQLHAYLGGLGVEIMANSDNVLRGGLTSKNIDVPELMRLVSYEPLEDPRLEPSADGFYKTPAPEFALQRLNAGHSVKVEGPAIVLSVDDSVLVNGERLGPADAVWVGATSAPVQVEGNGFIARVGE